MHPEKAKKFESVVSEKKRRYKQLYAVGGREIENSQDMYRLYTRTAFAKLTPLERETIAKSNLIVTIPVLSTSEYEKKHITKILDKFQNQTLHQNRFALFVLVNSSGEENFESNCIMKEQILNHISNSGYHNIVTKSINWSGGVFSNINMGHIRRHIYDTIVLAKSERAIDSETAIITFDSDVIDFSDRLLEKYYGRILLNPDKNEMVAGNVNWNGNTGNDIYDVKLLIHQVNLSLCNIQDTINGNRHKYPSEGNTAFKLSTYCSHGTINPDKLGSRAGENDLLLNFTSEKFSAYDSAAVMEPSAWIKTNPRRLVYQIIRKREIDDAWQDTWNRTGEEGRNNNNLITSFNYKTDEGMFDSEIKKMFIDEYIKRSQVVIEEIYETIIELRSSYDKNEASGFNIFSAIFTRLTSYLIHSTTNNIEYFADKCLVKCEVSREFKKKLFHFLDKILVSSHIEILPDEIIQKIKNSDEDSVNNILTELYNSMDEDQLCEHLCDIAQKAKEQLANELSLFVENNFSYANFDTSRLKRVLDGNRKRYDLDNPVNEIKPQFKHD